MEGIIFGSLVLPIFEKKNGSISSVGGETLDVDGDTEQQPAVFLIGFVSIVLGKI